MQLPLTILRYHRVLPRPDPLLPCWPDAAGLERQLRQLHRWCRVLPLGQAVRRLRERSLPARAVCITFDGGYGEHAGVALPLLQRFGLPATFFVASGFLDGGYSWSDAVVELVRKAPGPRLDLGCSGLGSYDIACPVRRRGVLELLLAALATLPLVERLARVHGMVRCITPTMLTSDQLIALHRAGMEVGAHTVTQQALSTLSNAEARAEIANSRARLEDIVQAPVRLFSYPDGKPGADFEKRHANMLRSAGFEAAVTTASGTARAASDPFELPRLMPADRSKGALLLQLGGGLLAPA